MSVLGPAFPQPHLYAPYFCEENAYQLARKLPRGHVVFITNQRRTAATFYQRASQVPPDQGAYVVWDYHVVVVHDGWVYDADSLLCPADGPQGVEVSAYCRATFPLPSSHPLAPAFRVVSTEEYVRHFASDRSHMVQQGEPIQPFPPWEPICGPSAGSKHNLPLWLDMSYQGDGFGQVVLDRDALVALLGRAR